MNRICEREREVVDALRTGFLGHELQEHTLNCPDCAEAAMVATFLQQEAQAAEAEAELPSAESVWWKARLDARREALKRATQPIAMMRNIACAAAAVVALVFLFSGQLARILHLAGSAPQLQSLTTGFAGMASVFGTLGILAFVVVGTLYLAMTER